MTNESGDLTHLASASAVENMAHLLRNCEAVTLRGEHPTREQAEAWIVDFLWASAGVTLTAEQRAESVAVIRELPSTHVTMDRFITACEGEPLLAELAAGLKSRLAGSSSLFSSSDDFEIDVKSIVDSRFESGDGVLTFNASTPDEVIVGAIRQALAAGKPFTVIPGRRYLGHPGEQCSGQARGT